MNDLKQSRPHWNRTCALAGCGAAFTTTHTGKKFCSRAHAQEAAYRARQERRRAAAEEAARNAARDRGETYESRAAKNLRASSGISLDKSPE